MWVLQPPPFSSAPTSTTVVPPLRSERMDRKNKRENSEVCDFNLPNIDWKSYYSGDYYESMFLEMVMDSEMEQIVDFCTRRANVLDLILVSGRISPLKIEIYYYEYIY